VLLRSVQKAAGCAPPTAITKTASLIGKVFVLQIAAECIDSLYGDGVSSGPAAKLWEAYTAMKPALTLFALPNDAAAFECAARLQHKGMPMMWLRAADGAALADALAADPSKVLKLMRLPGATVSYMPADVAGQPMDYSSMGPVRSSSSVGSSSSSSDNSSTRAAASSLAHGLVLIAFTRLQPSGSGWQRPEIACMLLQVCHIAGL
jgi:hypothetical protein